MSRAAGLSLAPGPASAAGPGAPFEALIASLLPAGVAWTAAGTHAAMVDGRQQTAVDEADVRDIEATLDGDGDAYARLVRRHQDAVSRLMHRFTRDRAVREQLVQDAFVEAWHGLAGYRRDAPFRHWLRRIATRVGYRHWRQAARARARAAAPEDGAAADLATTEDPSDPREAAELVHAMLALLPPRDRLVLTLVHLQGCGTREVAELTGWSRTLVKVAAFRARKRLGALLRRRGHA